MDLNFMHYYISAKMTPQLSNAGDKSRDKRIQATNYALLKISFKQSITRLAYQLYTTC